jgi:hypothetical protein
MSIIIFTVSVAKSGKGRYVASAREFPIMGEPASTRRGAVRKLKAAVLLRIREAAEIGTLPNLLEDCGYNPDLIWFERAKMQSHPFKDHDASVLLPRRIVLRDRAKRDATGDERNQP